MLNNSSGNGESGNNRLHRDLGVIGLLFIAVGATFGSAWLFGALNAAKTAGPASLISWGIGSIMVIFLGFVYAELGAMFPVSGGIVRYPHFTFGSFTSYMFGWSFWIACASTTALEVLAALQYAKNYLPWLEYLNKSGQPTLGLAGYGVGVALLALFSLINIWGIQWIRRLNNALVWWKLGIIALVIASFIIIAFHGGHFSDAAAGGFFPFGWEGVFSAVSTSGVAFAYLGFREGIDLSGESHNPQRYVPIAVLGAILISTVLYIGLEVAFIGALPKDALANGWANIGQSFTGDLSGVAATFGPLAAIAGFMGLSWLAGMLYVDAFISPADSGLILSTVTTRISYAMGRNRNAPHSLAKVSERGVPWVSVILTFVAGIIFLFLFPGWGQIVGFVTSATIITFGAGPLVLLSLRLELPDRDRPFRIRCAYVMSYFGFLSTSLIFYWTGWGKIWKFIIALLIGFVIYIIHEFVNKDKTPDLELRSGIWAIVWLGGLTLLSWLGPYPDISEHVGNLGLIGVKWSILVLAVFSFFVMWMALHWRLPAEKIKTHLKEAEEEMEEGEIELEESD
jgi:amino acid transporter